METVRALSPAWALLALAWSVLSVWGHLPFSLWLVRQREASWGPWALTQAVPAVTAGAALLLCLWLWRSARGASARRRRQVLGCWALWLVACGMIDRWLTFTVNEYAHYPQYALLACLLGKALDSQRTRWPLTAIVLLSTLASGVDEMLQYLWTTRSYSHYLDFNDLLVNLVAAWGGVMLYYGFAEPPPRGVVPRMARRLGMASLAVVAALALLGLAGRSCDCVRMTPAPAQQVAPGGRDAGVLYLQRAQGWYGHWHNAPRHGRYHVLHPVPGLLLMLLTLAPLAAFTAQPGARRAAPP